MSYNYLNNQPEINSFTFDEHKALFLNQTSSEINLESIIEPSFISFCDKNTNEMSFIDEKNYFVKDKIEESAKDEGNDIKSEIKFLGRKKKGEKDKNSSHNKFADDNTRRKVKRLLISLLQLFINAKIAEKYGNKIGEGMIKKRLMQLCQAQIANASIRFNLQFLNKTLGDIFSEDVTKKITNFGSDRNKEIVQELINEEDENKRNYFRGLFNVTFYECLTYFRNDDQIDNKYLKGLPKFYQIREEFKEKEGQDYTNHFEEYLKKYEDILKNKKPRNGTKRKKDKN